MRKLVTIFLLAAALSVPALVWARDIAKTLLTSTGASVSATVGCGAWAVQSDSAVCVSSGQTTSTATCTLGQVNTGVLISAGQIYDMPLPCGGSDAADTISVISVSGTSNVQVFRVAL
jgi:hypothetical protein